MKGKEKYLGWGPSMFAVVTVLLIACLWSTWTVKNSVQTVISQTAIGHTTMITKWESLGIEYKIETHLGEQNPKETDSEHAHRHRNRFVAMLRLFPKQE